MRTTALSMALAILCVGCINPGRATAEALGQKKEYKWDANENFSVIGEGSQTEAFTMMQGNLAFVRDEDTGELVFDIENSQVHYYLQANPSANAAASSFGLALQASVEQSKAFSETFTATIGMLVPLITAGMAAPRAADAPDPGGGAQEEMLRRLIDSVLSERGDN